MSKKDNPVEYTFYVDVGKCDSSFRRKAKRAGNFFTFRELSFQKRGEDVTTTVETSSLRFLDQQPPAISEAGLVVCWVKAVCESESTYLQSKHQGDVKAEDGSYEGSDWKAKIGESDKRTFISDFKPRRTRRMICVEGSSFKRVTYVLSRLRDGHKVD